MYIGSILSFLLFNGMLSIVASFVVQHPSQSNNHYQQHIASPYTSTSASASTCLAMKTHSTSSSSSATSSGRGSTLFPSSRVSSSYVRSSSSSISATATATASTIKNTIAIQRSLSRASSLVLKGSISPNNEDNNSDKKTSIISKIYKLTLARLWNTWFFRFLRNIYAKIFKRKADKEDNNNDTSNGKGNDNDEINDKDAAAAAAIVAEKKAVEDNDIRKKAIVLEQTLSPLSSSFKALSPLSPSLSQVKEEEIIEDKVQAEPPVAITGKEDVNVDTDVNADEDLNGATTVKEEVIEENIEVVKEDTQSVTPLKVEEEVKVEEKSKVVEDIPVAVVEQIATTATAVPDNEVVADADTGTDVVTVVEEIEEVKEVEEPNVLKRKEEINAVVSNIKQIEEEMVILEEPTIDTTAEIDTESISGTETETETTTVVAVEEKKKEAEVEVDTDVVAVVEPPSPPPPPQQEQVPKGDRWAIAAPGIDLSANWKIIVTDKFKKDYDSYLKSLGQPSLVRSIAVSIVELTTEEIIQDEKGRSLCIKGKNLRGVWGRTLLASGSDYDSHFDFEDGTQEHDKVELVTADKEKVQAEAWWEDNGTVHRSYLRGVKKYGGGDFESKRYLEDGGETLVCESLFHPKNGNEPAVIKWTFSKT